MRAVWPGVVVGEGSLTQAIADIRKILRDEDHRLVRNVARRGYLLTAGVAAGSVPSVLPAAELHLDAMSAGVGVAAEISSQPFASRLRDHRLEAAVGIAVVAMLLGAGLWAALT